MFSWLTIRLENKYIRYSSDLVVFFGNIFNIIVIHRSMAMNVPVLKAGQARTVSSTLMTVQV